MLTSSRKLSPGAKQPHLLIANRYIALETSVGGADGCRTLTILDSRPRLQSGPFCSNCLAWANECYWRCDCCNEGDWGFCNTCVNQGKCYMHALLPLALAYRAYELGTPPTSLTFIQTTPLLVTILSGPGVVGTGIFKPLTFRVECDICRHSI
jgi:hypothetical protein